MQLHRMREEVVFETTPTPEEVVIEHEGLSPICTLKVVVDGKVVMYNLNRRLVFGLLAQIAAYLFKLEPGKWVNPYETQTALEKTA